MTVSYFTFVVFSFTGFLFHNLVLNNLSFKQMKVKLFDYVCITIFQELKNSNIFSVLQYSLSHMCWPVLPL